MKQWGIKKCRTTEKISSYNQKTKILLQYFVVPKRIMALQ